MFSVSTQFPADADLILMNTLLSLNVNYAFTCALKAVQDHMYRGKHFSKFLNTKLYYNF